MTKIKEVIEIKSSYSAQVDLKKEFNNRSLKKERMAQYKPIKSHRKAFEIIAEGAYLKDSKRCYILSGSYGTGKSHLCLMASNYFESQSDTEEMREFFKNYSESEENEEGKKAELLKTIRKQGRYLVSICDYGKNSFETYVLKAIMESLKRENINENELDSYYNQAVNKITEWENSNNNYFFKQLKDNLENNNKSWTVNKLKKELSIFNTEAIKLFKEIHKDITTVDYQYDKDNYTEIITEIAKSKIINEKFAGMVIIFDEFDYQLKGKRFDLDEFQKFAQMCAASFTNNFPIIFVATTHKSFASYKSVYNAQDFLTVNDRIKEIQLQTEGIEEIISAIVNPKKDSDIWNNQIRPNVSTFNKLANKTESIKIFEWLPAPKVRKRIIENIFPMHPMATYALLKLASDLGSNNRSVFTFFANQNNEIGSYDWFVKKNDIKNTHNRLQFYTVDLLFDYFKDKMDSNNEELRGVVRDYIRDFESSAKELNIIRSTEINNNLNLLIYDQILRTMIIFELIGLPINKNNLIFGLNLEINNQESELIDSLNVLIEKKVIYFNDTNNSYEFKKSDSLDISRILKEYKENTNNIPSNIIEVLQQVIKNDDTKKLSKLFKNEFFLVPESYNFDFKEDKRLLREYATIKDMEGSNYFNDLIKKMKSETSYDKSYEGISVHVFCETEDDIKKAKNLVRSNDYNEIIIGIPTEEIPIYDDVFSLKAVFSIDTNDFSTQDIAMLKEYKRKYVRSLSDKINKYINSRHLIYYGKNGTELTDRVNQNDTAAKIIMGKKYEEKKNKINHEDINKIHEFKEKQNTSLKEAVEKLLDISSPIIFRKDYAADRGDIRYIRDVLFSKGVIKERQSVNNKVICDIERNTNMYRDVLPALVDMIEEIKTLDSPVNLNSFLDRYMREYGIGYNALILFFAVVKRYFKDSITIIPDTDQVGNLELTSYDNLLSLIYRQKYRNAIIEYREINEYDRHFIDKLYTVITENELIINEEITIDRIIYELKEWYHNLNSVNKVKSIYNKNRIENFLEVFNCIDSMNSRDFLLEEIKTIYGYERQDLVLEDEILEIINSIKEDKSTIENGYYIVRDNIVEKVKKIFKTEKVTYEDINNDINIWFSGLSDIQRDYNYYLQEERTSKPLAKHIGKDKPFEKLFMEILPSEYHLDSVINWNTDKTNSYIEKIKDGKRHIEENIFSINPPKYELLGKDVVENSIKTSDVKIKYRNEITIIIKPDENNEKIYVTSNAEDPRNINSQRKEDNKKFIYTTSEDKIIKFVGMDNEGKFSKVITLDIENEDNKFEVKYVKGQNKQIKIGDDNILREDPKVQVTLPKDKESLEKCLISLFKNTKKKYEIDDEIIVEVLNKIIMRLKE